MLDFKTLLTLNFIVNLISLLTMTLLWRRYAQKFEGLSFWLANMAAQAAGIGLILFRGSLPGFVTIVLGNAILGSSTLFLLMGMERFTGRVTRQWGNFAAFALYVLALWCFYELKPDIALRTIAISTLIILMYGQICWLLFRRVSPAMRRMTLLTGVVLGGYIAASLVRIAILLLLPRDAALFRSGLADSVAVTSYLSLHILLIISLVMALTRRLLDEVQAQEEKFAKAFHSSPYALLITRCSDGRIVEVNDGFSHIFGFARSEALGRALTELGLSAELTASNSTAYGQRLELNFVRKSGSLMVGQYASEPLVIHGEECVLSSIADVTEESRLKQRLKEMATHDSLTNLPNRRCLLERFDIARLNAERHDTGMALLSMDLDKFKDVNDELGHAAGDEVLIEAAKRLTGCLRKVDVVARFGGDEFVILLTEAASLEDASRVAGKIVHAFRSPFQPLGREVSISASLGLAIFPHHGRTLEELLRHSDKALYRTKNAGRNGYTAAELE